MIKPFISQTGKWVFDFRLDWNHVLQMTKSRKRKCFFFFFFFFAVFLSDIENLHGQIQMVGGLCSMLNLEN
jgi:hypothetical protein